MLSLTSSKTYLLLILIFASVIRTYQAYNFPLSGDEVGVGVLQATGHALDYKRRLPTENFPIGKAQLLINYEDSHGIKEVLDSLKHGGMHPPFYYIALHYIIKFLGNDTFTLRFTSIIFSLISIYLIYHLGSIIYNENVGLFCSLLVSISPYCIQYSVMVRPYPLLMTIGLLSTLLLYNSIQNNNFKLNSSNCILYIILSSIGMYTMYHYVFVIIFQLFFVVLSEPKNLKSIGHTIFIYFIVLISYIPWLPALKEQLKVVNGNTFYFHDKLNHFNLISFVTNTIHRNFTRDPHHFFPQTGHYILELSITLAVLIVFFVGYWQSITNNKSKKFTLSLTLYFIIAIAGDKIMQTNTISWEKFQFFLIPMLFLIFSYGLSVFPRKLFIRHLSFAIICFFLVISSYSTAKAKVCFDGPYVMKYFQKIISASVGNNEAHKTLLILNTNQRRYLFSLIHGMDKSIDIIILQNKERIVADLNSIKNIRNYNEIFVCDFVVNRNKKARFAGAEVSAIVSYLLHNNFPRVRQLIDSPSGALVSFTHGKSFRIR